MWDNHQALTSLANWLFALAALIVSYLITQLTINSPSLLAIALAAMTAA